MNELCELLADWKPDLHGDLSTYLGRVAREFATESPG